jgi:hypothetical protein
MSDEQKDPLDLLQVAPPLDGRTQTTNYLTNFNRLTHKSAKRVGVNIAGIQRNVELRTQLSARRLSYREKLMELSWSAPFKSLGYIGHYRNRSPTNLILKAKV